MGAFSSLRSYNTLIQYLNQDISSYVSRVFKILKANPSRNAATGLTGLALAVSFLAAPVTHRELNEAMIDRYALEQPGEPIKAQFESATSDNVKRSENFKAWLRLSQIAAGLEDMVYSMQNDPKYKTQIKVIYDSADEVNSLAESYKEKIIRDVKTRFEEKAGAFRDIFLAMFLGILAVPYVSSLWMKKEHSPTVLM